MQRRKDEMKRKMQNSNSNKQYRYFIDDFFEEREVVEQLMRNPKYGEIRTMAYDWIDTNLMTLNRLKDSIYREVNEVSKEIDHLEETREKLKNGETPEVLIHIPEKVGSKNGVAVVNMRSLGAGSNSN